MMVYRVSIVLRVYTAVGSLLLYLRRIEKTQQVGLVLGAIGREFPR